MPLLMTRYDLRRPNFVKQRDQSFTKLRLIKLNGLTDIIFSRGGFLNTTGRRRLFAPRLV